MVMMDCGESMEEARGVESRKVAGKGVRGKGRTNGTMVALMSMPLWSIDAKSKRGSCRLQQREEIVCHGSQCNLSTGGRRKKNIFGKK